MSNANSQEKSTVVFIETNYGNIKVKLYDDTPLHKSNFLKLAREGFYDDLLFHRVIKDFVIQGGDPDSRNAIDSTVLGSGGLDYKVPAEFRFPKYYHRRGVLAAARQGDATNPEQASSSTHFYIVTGKVCTDEYLSLEEKQRFEKFKQKIFNQLQSEHKDEIKAFYAQRDSASVRELKDRLMLEAEQKAEERKLEVMYTPQQREVYRTEGGVPRLDGAYTVFGEVIEGMDIVDKIQDLPTKPNDRPLENVRMKMVVIDE